MSDKIKELDSRTDYETLIISLSDLTTDLTTEDKEIFLVPFDMYVVDDVYTACETAPVGATLIVDGDIDGTSIFGNKPTIAISATKSTTSHLTNRTWKKGQKLTLTIDQVGSDTAGAGLKMYINYFKVDTPWVL